jgi:hypothetical protein
MSPTSYQAAPPRAKDGRLYSAPIPYCQTKRRCPLFLRPFRKIRNKAGRLRGCRRGEGARLSKMGRKKDEQTVELEARARAAAYSCGATNRSASGERTQEMVTCSFSSCAVTLKAAHWRVFESMVRTT